MQLTPKKTATKRSIGCALAAATCSLLGVGAQAGDKLPGSWDINAAVLYYGEGDGRVQAVEPVVSATRYFANEKALNLKLVVDTLTGASPTGATPGDEVQTFTRPSGNGQYEVGAAEPPLDDTFRDTRVALSAAWSQPVGREWSYSAALYGSNEYDYQSFGASGTLGKYFNQKNTQLNLGVSFSADSIDPVGGRPAEVARMAVPGMAQFDEVYATSRTGTGDDKTLVDLLFGVTQIINKRSLVQFNYSYSQADGYLTDPYKILSVIEDATGANATDDAGLPIYLYEARPDSRAKHALYWQAKYMLAGGDVLDGSYRFMTDDWGITSHTVDFKYRWQLAQSYLEPHLRYYLQSEADFYQRYLLASNAQSVEFASADYRLGELTATTLGLKYGAKLWHNDFSVRLEYYLQTNQGAAGFGALAGKELYPDTNAVMFTLSYSY